MAWIGIIALTLEVLAAQDHAGSDACAACHDNVGDFMQSKMARTKVEGTGCQSCHFSRMGSIEEPGVACERCHGPAAKHVSANGAAPVRRPKDSSVCTQCHAPHQAALAQSKCKQASRDKLWCATCHDPHRTLETAERAARYRAKCRSCHAETHRAAAGRDDCVRCHMPSAPAERHVPRTDHSIRKLARSLGANVRTAGGEPNRQGLARSRLD